MTEENMNNENMLSDKLAPPPQINETEHQQIIYILDTNILLHQPFTFLSVKAHEVVRETIPLTYISENLLDEGDTLVGKLSGWGEERLSILDLGFNRLLAKSTCGKTDITSTIRSTFVQTSVKTKSLAQFLQRKIIKTLSFTHRINTASKLSIGECYV